MAPTSLGILQEAKERNDMPLLVAVVGSGENTLILWRYTDRTEVIETNGDPVWNGEDGFSELRELFIGL
jgi:hypothetical protein